MTRYGRGMDTRLVGMATLKDSIFTRVNAESEPGAVFRRSPIGAL